MYVNIFFEHTTRIYFKFLAFDPQYLLFVENIFVFLMYPPYDRLFLNEIGIEKREYGFGRHLVYLQRIYIFSSIGSNGWRF